MCIMIWIFLFFCMSSIFRSTFMYLNKSINIQVRLRTIPKKRVNLILINKKGEKIVLNASLYDLNSSLISLYFSISYKIPQNR